MNRELTGIYYRVKRGDKYENIDFTDLTVDEQADILDKEGNEHGFMDRMFNFLQEDLNNLIDTFDLLNDEDFLKFMILSAANQIKFAGDMFDIVHDDDVEEEELTNIDLENMEIDQAYEQKQEEKLFN